MSNRTALYRLLLVLSVVAAAIMACTLVDDLAGGSQGNGEVEPPSGDTPFFVEEFEGSLPDWRDEILDGGSGSDADTSIVNGQFIYDIQSQFTYAYTFYEGETYTDVRLSVNAENRGHANNYITLVCRASESGWYELSIASDGFYSVDYYDGSTGEFENLDAGETDLVNLGSASNEFTATCQGNQLTLAINGQLATTVSDSRLTEGYIGIGAASFQDLPIVVAFDYLEASQP